MLSRQPAMISPGILPERIVKDGRNGAKKEALEQAICRARDMVTMLI